MMNFHGFFSLTSVSISSVGMTFIGSPEKYFWIYNLLHNAQNFHLTICRYGCYQARSLRHPFHLQWYCLASSLTSLSLALYRLSYIFNFFFLYLSFLLDNLSFSICFLFWIIAAFLLSLASWLFSCRAIFLLLHTYLQCSHSLHT